jgi:hypothetical protein
LELFLKYGKQRFICNDTDGLGEQPGTCTSKTFTTSDCCILSFRVTWMELTLQVMIIINWSVCGGGGGGGSTACKY